MNKPFGSIKVNIPILYEDNHLLAVVKPADIPVVADSSGDFDVLSYLKQFLKDKYQKPGNVFLGLVHRLDRPVGGVMVFAKTSKAASRLSEQIRIRETSKVYLAVVEGCPHPQSGKLVDYLLKDTDTNIVSVVPPNTPGAKEAILEYTLLSQNEGLSLVKVVLHTGRSHQIRVQMAHNKTPLLGDSKYGKGQGRSKLALWSYEMRVDHPTTKERMCFTAPPPDAYPWSLFQI